MLVGRERELLALTGLLDLAREGRGGAQVLRGDVGIGKSALLSAAAEAAAERGMRVHAITGFQAEVHVPYAGLHRLLPSTLDEEAAPHRVALAALELVVSDRPALIVVDDGQWLDRSSWDAVTFLGRRLASDRVLLLIAMRDGEETERRLATAGLVETVIGPLDGPSAVALLDHMAPHLGSAARERVLADAAGNPLGLVEFGSATARLGPGALLPAWLPLSTRVERLFSALVAALPTNTRTMLLVAALSDSDSLDEILAAGSRLGGPVVLADAEPAVVSGLITVDGAFRLRFRHPLLRSALRQTSSASQRRLIHGALADVLDGEPDRQVWHRAATAIGPDEAMATELTQVADRIRRRSPEAALVALERAGELSDDRWARSGRLLAAMEVAGQAGRHDAVARIVAGIDQELLSPSERARMAWMRETSLGGAWTGAAKIDTLADIIALLKHGGDVEQALESLLVLAVRLYWSNPDDQTRDLFLRIADGLGVPPSDPRLLCVVASFQPVRRSAEILASLVEHAGRTDSTPRDLCLLGATADAVGALHLASTFYAAAIPGLRAQDRIGTLTWALTGQAWNAAQLGDTRLGLTAAAEARSLALEFGQPMQAVLADLARGQVEALRGNASVARELADEGERALVTAGAPAMLARVDLVRGCESLAAGRAAEAYDHLSRIFEPSRATHHPYLRFAALGHLAEASVHCGRLDDLRRVVADLEASATVSPSPVLTVTLRYAWASLAADDDAGERFESALAADLAGWPFERARLQLGYGAWLRRQRRNAEARPVLRSADTLFNALGVTAWSDRARRELRATGESLRRPVDGRDQLTPQELQVAQLAADGLTNREIAERLFLSPRTVTTHLSRIFPKLGITSRRDLTRVMVRPPA